MPGYMHQTNQIQQPQGLDFEMVSLALDLLSNYELY